jgi:hypothetical protein
MKYGYVPHWQWLVWISYVPHSPPKRPPDLLNLPVHDKSINAQGIGLGAHEKDSMNEMTTLLKESVVQLRENNLLLRDMNQREAILGM